ncbi:chemotaxis protein CheB [Mycobacterium sherrisii]|uniref:chemotaxis protein CheB n=1 Tax=Mycobacterium sherrisii TaxID=243061 RepID=UPI003975F3A9
MATDTQRPGVELVVLMASAGGLEALLAVLGDLPTEFGAAIVVQQHLGGQSSVLPMILQRSTAHPVCWARDRQTIEPGPVTVCPPDMHMELVADRTCRLRRMGSLSERRFDVLLVSVAGSYGPRALAVVLSGSGRDGAEGVRAMKRAGAIVIAQSPGTADYPSMPMAAAEAGADLILPVHDIGGVLAAIARGAPIPPAPERASAPTPPAQTGAAPPDDQFREPSTRALDDAAARAEAARLRADELRRRRQDLAAGIGATAQTVAMARRRAEESVRRAQQAQQAARRAVAQLRD